MGVTFRRRISWPENDLLFPAELFNVTVPPGLCSMDVRVPNIVDINKMNQLSSGAGYSSSSGGLSSAYGFVNPKLTAIFPNPAAQWRRTPAPGAKNSDYGPCQFQFTGGEVILDLTLEIYVITAAEIDPNDDLSVQIFACVYEQRTVTCCGCAGHRQQLASAAFEHGARRSALPGAGTALCVWHFHHAGVAIGKGVPDIYHEPASGVDFQPVGYRIQPPRKLAGYTRPIQDGQRQG